MADVLQTCKSTLFGIALNLTNLWLRYLSLSENKVYYSKYKISKGNGSFRTIYAVNDEYKKQLRSIIPHLGIKLLRLEENTVNHGFIKGRNCVSNAMQHIGYRYTLSMDLINFFDSIRPSHVSKYLTSDIISKCFVEGAPRQGLPTSPIISAIAFIKYDNEIIKSLKKHEIRAVYTRYADDLIFSFDREKDGGKIQYLVKQILDSAGFTINNRKTKLQSSKNGRVIITGIGVDKNGLHVTRKIKKKIRAAFHQQNVSSHRGLTEWSKCKLPRQIKEQ